MPYLQAAEERKFMHVETAAAGDMAMPKVEPMASLPQPTSSSGCSAQRVSTGPPTPALYHFLQHPSVEHGFDSSARYATWYCDQNLEPTVGCHAVGLGRRSCAVNTLCRQGRERAGAS